MANNNAINFINAHLTIPNYRKFKIKSFKDFSSKASGFQVLKNINFKLNKGDRYGLIGSNGSGKTTFLKLAAGVYKETQGKIIREVEIFPLILKTFLTSQELTGFHAIKAHYLMYGNNTIDFDEYLQKIINFTQLGNYIYRSIDTYSDGMKTRLLFSLLTSFKFECLALDEGLGTGDREFVERAQKRLSEFLKSSGTLILASHSDNLLKRFCDKGLVFKNGEIIFNGEINNALDFYINEYN